MVGQISDIIVFHIEGRVECPVHAHDYPLNVGIIAGIS